MPTINFDQSGIPAGVVDRSRSDVVLSTVVTVTATAVGAAVFGLLDRPVGSAAALSGAGLTRSITPDAAGSYRVRIIDDNDGSSVIHTFTVRTAKRGLPKPAHNERANPLANEVDPNGGSWVAESETNEGGSFKGWHDPEDEMWDAIDSSVPDSRTVDTGDGLKGGGDLTADRTLEIDLGNASATASTQTSTTSTVDVLIASLTITPTVTGTYLCMATISVEGDTKNEDIAFNIYVNGAVVAPADHVPVRANKGKNGPLASFSVIAPITSGDDIEVRWRTLSGETVLANTRRLDIIRISTP